MDAVFESSANLLGRTAGGEATKVSITRGSVVVETAHGFGVRVPIFVEGVLGAHPDAKADDGTIPDSKRWGRNFVGLSTADGVPDDEKFDFNDINQWKTLLRKKGMLQGFDWLYVDNSVAKFWHAYKLHARESVTDSILFYIYLALKPDTGRLVFDLDTKPLSGYYFIDSMSEETEPLENEMIGSQGLLLREPAKWQTMMEVKTKVRVQHNFRVLTGLEFSLFTQASEKVGVLPSQAGILNPNYDTGAYVVLAPKPTTDMPDALVDYITREVEKLEATE